MRPAAALTLASLLPLTSGCIAAAIPLAAGAAMMKTQAPRSAPAEQVAAPVAAASARSDLKIVRTSLTELPPPDQPMAPVNSAVPAFLTYALAQAEGPAGAGKRPSAILPAASDLRAVRADCAPLPSAVFVDLDPGRSTFDPLAPGLAAPALGAALATLRERGVRVVWFSRLGDSFAAPARVALAESGLDPAGRDELMLMSDLAERKQTLRDTVATRVCPVAMLGDERADFDELYLYLKNADTAIALDAMIGKGWFLASPFVSTPEPGTMP